MADDLIELAFEGVDRVSDPNFIYHRKRKEKRDRLRDKEGKKIPSSSPDNQQQDRALQESSPRRGRRRSPSPIGSFDDPGDRTMHPDFRNPNYGAPAAAGAPAGWYVGSEYDGDGQVSRARDYDDYGRDDRSSRSRRNRPGLRSRSSHQGDHSLYPDEYEDADDLPPRRSRSQKARSSKNKSRRSSPSPQGIKKVGELFSDSRVGLGALALGGVAGGYIGYRTGKNKEKSGEEGPLADPFILSILGAVAGGVGGNILERYVENGKEEGTVRDKWGDEVGKSRKELRDKMRSMTKGGSGSRDRDRDRDRDRRRYDDRY